MLPRYRGGGKSSRSRGAFVCARVLPKPSSRKPFARKATRVLKWSAGRRRGRGPRHADGCCHPATLRAWRAPQNDPLARTACFGRAAPPGAPPPSRFPAAAVDRRCLRAAFRSCQPQSPAGVLTERIDSLCNGKRDGCQGLNSCVRRVGRAKRSPRGRWCRTSDVGTALRALDHPRLLSQAYGCVSPPKGETQYETTIRSG